MKSPVMIGVDEHGYMTMRGTCTPVELQRLIDSGLYEIQVIDETTVLIQEKTQEKSPKESNEHPV